MRLLSCLHPLVGFSTFAAAQTHTGFCYGAFKDGAVKDVKIPKTYNDFKNAFQLAQTLGTGAVSFNSARLFQMHQWDTTDTPSEAFQAAIETNTTLLLGIWLMEDIGPQLNALDTAYNTHGQKFSDLVVGLSVGSEDYYRTFPDCLKHQRVDDCKQNATVAEIQGNITRVKDHIKTSTYKDLWGDKPIGHVEPVPNATAEAQEFVGMTAYPFWANQSIDKAHDSFFNSIKDFKDATNKPVWIAETGWPFSGDAIGPAVASQENAQTYWTKTGCELVGKYNLWWFELEDDVKAGEGYNWAVTSNSKSRIDFSCPNDGTGSSASSASGSAPAASSSNPVPVPSSSSTAETSSALASASQPPASSNAAPPSPQTPPASSQSPPASSSARSTTTSIASSPKFSFVQSGTTTRVSFNAPGSGKGVATEIKTITVTVYATAT